MFEAARETRVDLRADVVVATVGVGDWNIVNRKHRIHAHNENRTGNRKQKTTKILDKARLN